jgi:hypothetical protein
MIRLLTLSALLCLCSFRFPAEGAFQFEQSFAANSREEQFFFPNARGFQDEFLLSEADTSLAPRVLMLNYFAYDKAYPQDLKQLIKRRLPAAVFSEFWEGTGDNLNALLASTDCVVITYPYTGAADLVAQYGKCLAAYARQGGTIIVTGTHKCNVLQQLELIDVEKTYYSKNNTLKTTVADHALLKGVESEFAVQDFSYPLKSGDAALQTLVEINGYPVACAKPIGQGRCYYLGFEYYRDEPASATLLLNAIVGTQVPKPAKPMVSARSTARGNEYWVTGPAKADIKVKVYPNPYMTTATLDVELENPASVSIDMVDQTGGWVTTLLLPRNLAVGLYSFDLPNVRPGVYFVRCKVNGQVDLRKVVKSEGQ